MIIVRSQPQAGITRGIVGYAYELAKSFDAKLDIVIYQPLSLVIGSLEQLVIEKQISIQTEKGHSLLI
jgi:hypothetical protein